MTQTLLHLLLFFILLIYNNREIFCKSFESFKDSRIIGGSPVPIQNAPYMAFLFLRSLGGVAAGCGGTIVNSRTVLTAAHCLDGMSTAYIRIGSANKDSGGSEYETQALIMHSQYNRSTKEYDVGIVKIWQNMNLDGTNSKPVRLADSGTETAPGTELFVTGWGVTSEGGSTSSILLGVKVPVVSEQECRDKYGSLITARMICAGTKQGGKDSCQEDSGGPAISTETGAQVGIVSFGHGCGRPHTPGVYAKVSEPSILNFIIRNSRDDLINHL